MQDENQKHPDIREKLKSLERIDASPDFMASLRGKIAEIETAKKREDERRHPERRTGFLSYLLGGARNPWLIPAAGFTILLFFIFYMTYVNKNFETGKESFSSNQKQESTVNQDRSGNDKNSLQPGNTPMSDAGSEKNSEKKSNDLSLKGSKEDHEADVSSRRELVTRSEQSGKYSDESNRDMELSESNTPVPPDLQLKVNAPEPETGISSNDKDNDGINPDESRKSDKTGVTEKMSVEEKSTMKKKTDSTNALIEKLKRVDSSALERISRKVSGKQDK